MFMRRGKSTEGWAAIGFGAFACIYSVFGLSGGLGPLSEAGRSATLVYLGLPPGVTAIVLGIVALYRDARRARD